MTTNKIKKHSGIPPLLAALFVQFTLGIAYLWSLFQTGIADSLYADYAKPNAAAGLNFSLLIAMMTVGSVIGGKLVAKYTIRRVVFIGGVLLGGGFFISGFIKPEFAWVLWLTYGIMGGLGMGFTYSTTIACAQKWFPHKRGLVTGVIVSGLGFGGVIFTPIITSLVARFAIYEPIPGFSGFAEAAPIPGSGEQKTFMILAGIFFIVCTVGSLFLKNPSADYAPVSAKATKASSKSAKTTPAAVDFTTSEMLKSLRFYMITAAFLLACLGGLIVINYARQIAEMKGYSEIAVTGVLVISIFNSCGRLVWGAVSDKIGRLNTIIALMLGSATLTLFVPNIGSWFVFVLIAGIGFLYGGLLSTFPALTAETFGAKNVATNYGLVLLGFGAAAITASQVGGYFRDIARAVPGTHGFGDIDLMLPAFIIGSCCAAGAALLMITLKIINKRKGRNVR
ncbi:MAG: OFA family MFS transporter [Oscillospiraceae bacterium]|nr:OFA family MFS transporter [Oscillospiraceae bacterium]